jgi:glycosyltransferase involved in cell wall biosynthesis
MNPRITIITPSFNRLWSISSCLDSIRAQCNVDYEHIIMDGGSTDGTLEYLYAESVKDSRLRVISEPDSGMYDAVNKGMKLALGDIVAYLNTDDFYLPGALAEAVDAFEKNPNLSMIYGHWMSWHPEQEFLEIQPVQKYRIADFAIYAVLPQPSVFFRRSILEELGGFELSFKLLADNDFFSRVAVSGLSFKRLDAFLSVQTVHSGNLLAGNSEAIIKAKNEGLRYRMSRKREFAGKSSILNFLLLCKAQIKHYLLPVTWRGQLILRLLCGAFHQGSLLSEPWKKIEGKLSFNLLCGYLVSRSSRRFYPFFNVSQAAMSRAFGFQVPNCPPKIKNSLTAQQ